MSSNRFRRAAIFSSTHWDREWYRDFQTYRFHLVKVLNDAIEVLEREPAFSSFVLDGQTAMLEDYLEAIPQNRERVQKLLKEGRLKIGPFYTLPDENLVSGESLIANLKAGHEDVCAMTDAGVWPVGYLCDMFGHIAQMPQILRGFGIRNAIVGRGTNQSETPAYFTWRSPDGSEVTAFREPEQGGYGGFWYEVFCEDHQGSDEDCEVTRKNASREFALEQLRINSEYGILMDGVDHEPQHHSLPALAEYLTKEFGCPVEIGAVEQMFDCVRENEPALPVRIGELQRPAKEKTTFLAKIFGTLSSRVDIKQHNDEATNWLEKNAASASALALMHGIDMPDALLKTARKYLLQNHAHDSICGCSLGRVHEDMHYRFRQAETIAREYAGHVFSAFCPDASFIRPDRENGELCLKIMNPLPYPVDSVQKLDLWFPEHFGTTQTEQKPDEPVNSFRLFQGGKEVPYQILEITKDAICHRSGHIFPDHGHRYTILARVQLPPMGIGRFYIRESVRPVRFEGTLRTAPLRAENAHLSLTVELDGSVTLTDKASGRRYRDLLRFFHVGETGDAWYHRPPVGGAETWSTFRKVSVVYDGPVGCALRVEHELLVPKCLRYGRRKTEPSEELAVVTITATLRLTEKDEFVKLELDLDNTAEDGKICLSLPATEEKVFAETPFAFVDREPGYDTSTMDWFETDKIGKAFSGALYQPDGMAFVSLGGLHEGGVDMHTGRMVITLLRSFRKLFMTEDEPYGQLSGKHSFSALLLAGGTKRDAQLIRLKEREQTAFLHDTVWENDPLGESENDFLGICVKSENAVASVIRRSGDAVLVRLVNYDRYPAPATVISASPLKCAYRADLMENHEEQITCEGDRISLSVQPYEIRTVLLYGV